MIPTKKLQESPMTWARLLGLIQADGNFYFSMDEDFALRPKITVSVTPKRDLFINKIYDFLKKEGFNPIKNVSENNERATNIVISRIDQCARLLEKINLLEQGGLSLVGQKKIDCEILKEVINLNKTGKAADGSRTLDTKLKLVDLKDKLSTKPLETNVLDQESANLLAEQLKVDNWYNSASAEWREITNKAEKGTEEMIALSRRYQGNSKDIPQALGEFMSGVWDGDGSFQISIKSHVTKDGGPVIVTPKNKSPWKRRFIEIKPELSLTDHVKNSTSKNPLFIISENLFSSKPIKVSIVSQDKKAERQYYKSVADINKFVLPFFERFPPSYERALYRFKAFRLVTNAYNKILKNRSYNIVIVKAILESPFFSGEAVRHKSLSDYVSLIDKQFGKK